jgi:hypothetical protein
MLARVLSPPLLVALAWLAMVPPASAQHASRDRDGASPNASSAERAVPPAEPINGATYALPFRAREPRVNTLGTAYLAPPLPPTLPIERREAEEKPPELGMEALRGFLVYCVLEGGLLGLAVVLTRRKRPKAGPG